MVALSLVLSLLIGATWFSVVVFLDPHRREKASQSVLPKFLLAGSLCLIPTEGLYFASFTSAAAGRESPTRR